MKKTAARWQKKRKEEIPSSKGKMSCEFVEIRKGWTISLPLQKKFGDERGRGENIFSIGIFPCKQH